LAWTRSLSVVLALCKANHREDAKAAKTAAKKLNEIYFVAVFALFASSRSSLLQACGERSLTTFGDGLRVPCMAEDAISENKERFAQLFGTGEKVRAVRAPGRVNLIGEHTDYNDGFVFPMAIEPQVVVICRSRKNEIVKVASTVFPNEFVEFSLQKTIERGKPSWGNYVRGVAA